MCIGTRDLTRFLFRIIAPEAIKKDLNLTTAQVGNSNIVASVARLVWRFASDKGLPFHQHFTYVSLTHAQSDKPN